MQLALREETLNRECELVVSLPGIFSEERAACMKVFECRRVSGGCFGPFSRNEIQVGSLLTLAGFGNQGQAAVELTDNFKHGFFKLLLRGALDQDSRDAQVGLSALLLRDKKVGRFLDPVMNKAIGVLCAKDEACANCFPELSMHFFFSRILIHRPQQSQISAVSQAGELF